MPKVKKDRQRPGSRRSPRVRELKIQQRADDAHKTPNKSKLEEETIVFTDNQTPTSVEKTSVLLKNGQIINVEDKTTSKDSKPDIDSNYVKNPSNANKKAGSYSQDNDISKENVNMSDDDTLLTDLQVKKMTLSFEDDEADDEDSFVEETEEEGDYNVNGHNLNGSSEDSEDSTSNSSSEEDSSEDSGSENEQTQESPRGRKRVITTNVDARTNGRDNNAKQATGFGIDGHDNNVYGSNDSNTITEGSFINGKEIHQGETTGSKDDGIAVEEGIISDAHMDVITEKDEAKGDEGHDEDNASDDETIVHGTRNSSIQPIETRITLKLQVTGGKSAFGRALGLLKEFLAQAQKVDRWIYMAPWYDGSNLNNIMNGDELNLDEKQAVDYFPRFMNRNVTGKKKFDEYVSINLGHIIDLDDLKLDLGTWFQKGHHALYVDMLQAERSKEAGFIVNSHFTMDLEVIREMLEAKIGCAVGLKWKPIAGTYDEKGEAVRAIHVVVDAKYFNKALKALSNLLGRGTTGFPDGRKMRFFASLKNAKSATTKASIKKAIDRQRFFVKEVCKNYFSDILHLDVIPKGSKLPTMRTMITSIHSIQFPHLRMIHSVDETWSKIQWKGDYTYLTMPHIEEEAEIMMSNLLPFLRHKYGDGVLKYFTSAAIEESKDDRWDPVQKRVICTVDTNAELDDDDDTLGFAEAKKYIDDRKAAIEATKDAAVKRPALQEKSNTEIQQEAVEKVNAMTNAAEAAYYKDDDSISTLGSIGANTTANTIRTKTTTDMTPQTTSTSTSAPKDTTTIVGTADDTSVASSITMATFNTLQEKVTAQDSRFDRIEMMIAELLKGKQDGQPTLPSKDADAGGTSSTAGIGS